MGTSLGAYELNHECVFLTWEKSLPID